MKSILFCVALGLSLAGCSSPPPATIDGSWTGNWMSSQPNALVSSGTIAFMLTQSGTTIGGTGVVSPYGSGTVSGTYSPANGKLSGKVSASIGTVTFDGTVGGNSASGTYISSAGDNGTFSLSRK